MKKIINNKSEHPSRISQISTQYLLVVDLEATCEEKIRLPIDQVEIIEIAGSLVDMADFSIKDELSLFVKPTINSTLSEFCTKLTTITQNDVDNADTLVSTLPKFTEWVNSTVGENFTFGSWGGFDFRQIKRESEFKNIPDTGLVKNPINIKVDFSIHRGVKRGYGLKKALGIYGMTFDGTAHRGIDDVRNIIRLLPYIYKK